MDAVATKVEVVAGLLNQNKEMSPTEIVERCKAVGVEITPQMASVYKSNLVHGKVGQHKIDGKGKEKAKRRRITPTSQTINVADLDTVADLKRRLGTETLMKLVNFAE